ncbi:molybdopterin molybdotransferase MoeA [Streptomyces reniochalinae]|uniref:Molybdopterin molybdenumtransferase n=1 Tax=Streptomyces reniochalinae TaxID=2250578 RepID=A0A367EGB5_9ACTN|nr:molybdopterin molybdotransferase MoeA [Streptomyces reniochalinae]RCG17146.1 molybdopterin molybdenumtransferase MoeA [Streptomyces reniochalinae]
MSGADELDEAIALANSGRTRPDPPPAPRLKRIRRIQWSEHGEDAMEPVDPAGQAEDRHGRSAQAGHSGRGEHADGAGRPAPQHPVDASGASREAERPGDGEGHQKRAAHEAAPSWSDAVALAASVATPPPPTSLGLNRALGHTLAAPVRALTDLPPFDTSAMDGWAVSGPGPWELARTADGEERPGILAGDRSDPPRLADGEAIRIATGARVPAGTSAVLRWEAAERTGAARLRTATPPQPGTDIRPRGQECRTGDALLGTGSPVTPAVLGLAAAAGYDELEVVARPRAEVLVLGDELLHRGLPRDGRIRDALGPMVEPWLTALGADVTATRLLGDDAEALFEAVSGTTADVLVTTGGTAAGPVDHLQPTLRRAGARLLVHGVRVRPGHPMLLAVLDPDDEAPAAPDARTRPGAAGAETGARAGARPRYLVGLPGNPLAALSGLMTLAGPLLRALAGRAEPRPRTATLGAEMPGHPRDTRLVPVRREGSGVRSRVRPLRYAGPAMLRGVASCDALAVVPPGGAAPGEDVAVLDLPW